MSRTISTLHRSLRKSTTSENGWSVKSTESGSCSAFDGRRARAQFYPIRGRLRGVLAGFPVVTRRLFRLALFRLAFSPAAKGPDDATSPSTAANVRSTRNRNMATLLPETVVELPGGVPGRRAALNNIKSSRGDCKQIPTWNNVAGTRRVPATGKPAMTRDEILDAIPHREPFLLVDEIIDRSESRIVGAEDVHGRGVVLCRPLPRLSVGARRAVVRSGHAMRGHSPLPSPHGRGVGGEGIAGRAEPNDARVPVATRMGDVRFKRMVRPGDRIIMEVELKERLADAFFLAAKVTVDGKVAVRFEFACTAARREAGGGVSRSHSAGVRLARARLSG